MYILTFIGHFEVAEVEFLKRAVGQQSEFEHEQTIVSTPIVGDVELSQGTCAWLSGRGRIRAEWEWGGRGQKGVLVYRYRPLRS